MIVGELKDKLRVQLGEMEKRRESWRFCSSISRLLIFHCFGMMVYYAVSLYWELDPNVSPMLARFDIGAALVMVVCLGVNVRCFRICRRRWKLYSAVVVNFEKVANAEILTASMIDHHFDQAQAALDRLCR